MSSVKLTKLFKGIRFRLTLVYSTLFGLFICAFAYLISSQYFQSGRADFDSRLFNYSIDLSEYLIIDDSTLRIAFHIPQSEVRKEFPFILNESYYFVRSLDGRILSKSRNEIPFKEIPYDPALPLKGDYTHRFMSFKSGAHTYRAVNLKITNNAREEMILQVAAPSDSLEERERNHILMILVTLPGLLLTSSLASFFLAGNALNPIKSLTDSANNIAAKNLSLRVPVVNTGDEVEELSKTLNHLLERLEKSFKAQEHFVANASHQLNTPLAIIKGELDVLESKPRNIEEHHRYLKSMREELERLIDLVKNMLLVSRVESGLENFIFHPLRLDDLILGTTSRLRAKAKDKRMTVRFNIDESLSSQELEVMGEKQLLDSLFENILDNAIKYGPEETSVALDFKKIDNHMEVWIQDEGPGMTDEELKNILTHRFQRGSSISIPGSGIGLSIAYQIAEYHQIEIEYKKLEPRGSLFMIKFSDLLVS